MELLTAKQAKAIIEKSNDTEIYYIIKMIQTEAKDGKTVLHIYNNLKPETIQRLKALGYKVTEAPQISIQKDGLYYSIRW